MTDYANLLYAIQLLAALILSLILQFVFHRAYETNGYIWTVVMWGVGQVGLIVLAYFYLVPLTQGTAQEGRLSGWMTTFWSFVAAAIPVVTWQLVVHWQQIKRLFNRPVID